MSELPLDIENGMTFEELLATGTDTSSLYSSLLVDLIDQIELVTSPNVASDLNKLVEELIAAEGNNEEQTLIVNAICDILTKFTGSIDDCIQTDLRAQEDARKKLDALNITASLIPPEISNASESELFNTIATDEFKSIVKETT